MSRQAARVSAARRPTVPCEQPPPPDLTKPQLPKSFFVRVGINNTMPQSSVFFFFFRHMIHTEVFFHVADAVVVMSLFRDI